MLFDQGTDEAFVFALDDFGNAAAGDGLAFAVAALGDLGADDVAIQRAIVVARGDEEIFACAGIGWDDEPEA
jgi:hypothetical protein